MCRPPPCSRHTPCAVRPHVAGTRRVPSAALNVLSRQCVRGPPDVLQRTGQAVQPYSSVTAHGVCLLHQSTRHRPRADLNPALTRDTRTPKCANHLPHTRALRKQWPPVPFDDIRPHEVLLKPPAPRHPHLIPKPRLVQQPPNLLSQIKRIPRLKQQPSQSIAHRIRQPPNPAGDHRNTRRHRLNRGDTQRILSDRRHQANIRGSIMPRQFILRAPANRASKFIDRPQRVKRHDELKVTPSLPQNPASLMRHMKPLDHLTCNRGDEEYGLDARAPIPGGTGHASVFSNLRVIAQLGAGLEPRLRVAFRSAKVCPCWARAS